MQILLLYCGNERTVIIKGLLLSTLYIGIDVFQVRICRCNVQRGEVVVLCNIYSRNVNVLVSGMYDVRLHGYVRQCPNTKIVFMFALTLCVDFLADLTDIFS